jgi:hypothetical protein
MKQLVFFFCNFKQYCNMVIIEKSSTNFNHVKNCCIRYDFLKLPNLHTVPNQLDKSWYKSETLKSGERLDEKSGRLVRWGNSVSFNNIVTWWLLKKVPQILTI